MTSLLPSIAFIKSQWRILLFGFLLAFFSSPGQTFFISLFSGMVREELGLSHGGFGTIYAIGTLASAVCIIFAGRLADIMPLRSIALLIITGVGIAAMVFSKTNSLFMLAIAIFCLRFTGQGMMSHLYSTTITRRYVAERGRALAVAVLGHPASELFMPILALFLLALFDWRQVWQIIGILAMIIMIPAAFTLTEKSDASTPKINPDTMPAGRDGHHWTQMQMILHWRFWMLCGLVIAPAFTSTGLFFHQVYFAEIKNIEFSIWISGYIFYAIIYILGSFIAGALVDRFSATTLAPAVMLVLTLAAITLFFITPGVMIYIYFIIFGLSAGMTHTAVAPIWAEIYGTRYLGGIKAIAQALAVFSSALSPVLLGLMIDANIGFGVLIFILAIVPTVSAVTGFIATAKR